MFLWEVIIEKVTLVKELCSHFSIPRTEIESYRCFMLLSMDSLCGNAIEEIISIFKREKKFYIGEEDTIFVREAVYKGKVWLSSKLGDTNDK